MAKRRSIRAPNCTFCSTTARRKLTGSKPESVPVEGPSLMETQREVAYACWRSQHQTKARAYLATRGFVVVDEVML